MSETLQAFCLRLNNHPELLTAALTELLANECMVDVTLAAEGQTIRAHRLVLAAYSPYFKELLMQYKDSTQYPIIVLKGIPFVDLKAIVEFIYRGEIYIPRQQLQSVLNNGNELQIKGLHEFTNKNNLSNICLDTGADDDSDSTDNKSIDDKFEFNSKHTKHSMGKNCFKGMNACEVNEMKTNKNEKQMTTTRKTTKGSTNGGKCLKYDQNLFADNTGTDTDTGANDQMSGTGVTGIGVDDKSNKNFIICGKLRKNVSLNECELKRDNKCERSIPQLMNSNINDIKGHNIENSMTANRVIGTDSLVAFNLMEQSMMIDVKHNVNIDANQISDVSSDTTAGAFNAGVIPLYPDEDSMTDNTSEGNPKQQITDENDSMDPTVDEINSKCISDKNVMNENSFHFKVDDKDIKDIENYDKNTKKRIQKVSKAGIRRTGTSVRSYKQFKCPVCQKIYVSPQNMREHLRNTHTNPNQKYKCSVCEKEYIWKHALDRHFKTKHTGD